MITRVAFADFPPNPLFSMLRVDDITALRAGSYAGSVVLGLDANYVGYLIVGDEAVYSAGYFGQAFSSNAGYPNLLLISKRGLAGTTRGYHPIGEIVQPAPPNFAPGTTGAGDLIFPLGNSEPHAVYTYTRLKHDQWDVCSRCGAPRPSGALTQQKGILVCRQCWDNILPDRRMREISRTLNSSNPYPEGSDRRMIDRGFFAIDIEAE